MAEFTTSKRRKLRAGADESEVVQLVRNAIRPAYAQLPGCMKLGLLRIEGTRPYLATQHWESRTVWNEALGSATYQSWWEAYQPALEQWDTLMEFEDEWETESILGND